MLPLSAATVQPVTWVGLDSRHGGRGKDVGMGQGEGNDPYLSRAGIADDDLQICFKILTLHFFFSLTKIMNSVDDWVQIGMHTLWV